MQHTYETFRDVYLHDLEFTGDPEHGRMKKVHHIEHWNTIVTPFFPKGGNALRTIDLNDADSKVFVWSDIHFSHKNIMKYSGRPYPSPDLMNECLMGNYRNIVTDNDIVIFGGDISFTNDQETNDMLDHLPGYKIQIVGNHDMDRKGKLRKMNFDERHLSLVVNHNGKQLLFTHYPLTTVPEGCINVHGHIHQHPAPSANHINICVEHTNYAPKLLTEMLAQVL